MLEKSHTVKNKLEDTGCFSKVEIQLDTSSGPTATPECGYEVNIISFSVIFLNFNINSFSVNFSKSEPFTALILLNLL